MTKAPSPSKAKTPKDPADGGNAASEAAAVSPLETAQYIAEFAAELSFLARETRLDLLSYLLEMARLEALRTIHKNR
jgi:hypothetical protein